MTLKLSMILEAVDRATAPARKVRASLGGLISSVKKWGQEVRKNARDITSGARSLEHYQRRAERLRRVAIGRFFQAAGNDARRFASNLRAGIRNLDLLGRAGRGAKAGLGWLGGKALGLAKWGAAGVGALASFSIFDLFKTAGEFEQFQIVLEGTEGSAAKAKKAMAWVRKFAKDTPYELDQVTDAFVRARGLGIDPFTGAMRIMGDAAAGNRKSIMDAVEAIGDAQTGEFERLKEFQITSSSKGQEVTFSYTDKGGKGVLKTVKNEARAIREALLDIWSAKYSGNMVRLSRSFFGILANIKDLWSNFLLMVAGGGIFDKVKAKLDQWYQSMNTAAGNKKMQEWAQAVSDGLSEAFDWAVKFIEDTNWKEVGADLRAIAGAVADAARWMGALARLSQTINPLKGGLLGSVMRREQEKAAARTGPAQRQRQDAPNRRTRAPTRAPQAPAAGRGNWRRLPSASKPQAAAPAQVGGRLAVDINVKGPATARVTRLETANRAVPIDARLGKAMGAPA